MAIKSIIVKGDGVRYERVANAAITPGHLVEFMSTDKFRVHATANGSAAPIFAVENDLEGEGITDAYAANDQCQANVMGPGDAVYALIKDGENIAIGDRLVSAGDGTLREAPTIDSGSDLVQARSVVAYSLDAVDMSGSSGVDPSTARCRVMVV